MWTSEKSIRAVKRDKSAKIKNCRYKEENRHTAAEI